MSAHLEVVQDATIDAPAVSYPVTGADIRALATRYAGLSCDTRVALKASALDYGRRVDGAAREQRAELVRAGAR